MRQRIDRRMIEGRAVMVVTRGRPASLERRTDANAALRVTGALTGANVRPEPRQPRNFSSIADEVGHFVRRGVIAFPREWFA